MKSTPHRYDCPVTFGCLLLLAALIGAILVLAAVPPLSRDALTHHLYVPKLYLKYGGMVEIPWVEFSYFPMNLDLLYLIPLAFGNDVLQKYIHFLFAIFTAVLVYYQLKNWLRPVYGWIGALYFLAIPIIIKLSVSVYVDLGLVFFSTLSLTSLIAWIKSPERLRYLVVSAIATGLALGTKYNGLIVYFLVSLSVPLIYLQAKRRSELQREIGGEPSAWKYNAVKYFLLHSAIALLLFSPWAIRNFVWTGNPLYPLYERTFSALQLGPSTPEDHRQKNIRAAFRQDQPMNHFLIRRMVYQDNWWEIGTAPIRIFFQGQDDHPRYFDGKLHAALLLFPFLALWGSPQEPRYLTAAKRLLVGFAVLYILIVFFTTDLRARYIAPAIPPLVLLSVCGLHNLVEILRNRYRARYIPIFVIVLFIGSIAIPTGSYLFSLNNHYFPFSYLDQEIERDDYIEHFWPEYPVLRFANLTLPDNARILSIFGGNRGYYADRSIYFNNSLFENLIKKSHTAKDIVEALTEMQFTHVMINYPMFSEWTLPRLSKRQQQIAASLLQNELMLLFDKNAHMLFALKPP